MRRRMWTAGFFWFFCFLFALSGAAFAAHPLITDDTGTQGTGKFQLEATGTWLTDQEDEGGEGVREISSFATIVFTAGIAESLDLVVGVPYVWTETREFGQITREDRVSDTVMEAKWRFYDKRKVSLAIKPGILLPTGDDGKGLGTDHVGYTALLISTIEAEPWSFNANLGYLHIENRGWPRRRRCTLCWGLRCNQPTTTRSSFRDS